MLLEFHLCLASGSGSQITEILHERFLSQWKISVLNWCFTSVVRYIRKKKILFTLLRRWIFVAYLLWCGPQLVSANKHNWSLFITHITAMRCRMLIGHSLIIFSGSLSWTTNHWLHWIFNENFGNGLLISIIYFIFANSWFLSREI